VVERPVLAFHFLDGPDGSAVFPHTLVVAEDDSEVTVLEHRSSFDHRLLSSAVAELVVGDNARVNFLGVQNHGRRVWEVALQRAHLGRDARVTSSSVALGGDYARLRSEVLAGGQGGSADLLAVYFGDGGQMLDFRTLQDHEAPHTSSNLLFKGAVEHQAHSVYSGLIKLGHEARKADAHQTNRTLKLSPQSHAESVPNLEILANDVVCTHASAIGPIDDEEMYYLQSRGVPPEVAERLVVLGFFEDVFERLPVGSLADPLREAVREKFERRDARG
jgi:Fe-S cluster assembly protein SufD